MSPEGLLWRMIAVLNGLSLIKIRLQAMSAASKRGFTAQTLEAPPELTNAMCRAFPYGAQVVAAASGVRWQFGRDTALGVRDVARNLPRLGPCESAVAAALCRRTIDASTATAMKCQSGRLVSSFLSRSFALISPARKSRPIRPELATGEFVPLPRLNPGRIRR